jgi:hypothetical protein
MENLEVLSSATHTLIDKPITIEIDIVNPTLLDRIKFIFGAPRVRKFELRPIVAGNLIRISDLLLSVDVKFFVNEGQILNENYTAMSKHAKTMARVLAIGLHGKESEPPESLVKFILANFSASEMRTVISYVIKQMNVAGFMNTIISAVGMSPMKDPGEIIASGEPSEE